MDTVRGFGDLGFAFSGMSNAKGRGETITFYVSEKILDMKISQVILC